MKILSWIAPAAAVITAAWATTVPPFDNSAFDLLEDDAPPIQRHPSITSPAAKTIDNHVAAAAPAPTKPLSFKDYNRCRQHIVLNFQRLKTANQIALECHLDVDYVRRNFQYYAHQSPEQYLLRVKMMRASAQSRPLYQTTL
jgi:AraC-like DNA-binding protein